MVVSRGTTRRLFFFTARSLVDDAARCHCRIRPVHFRVCGEEKAYSRTTAGAVSNNVRRTTYEQILPYCFTLSSYRNSRGGQTRYTSHVTTLDTFFLFRLACNHQIKSLALQAASHQLPHQPSARFHTFGLRTTTSRSAKDSLCRVAGPQVQHGCDK